MKQDDAVVEKRGAETTHRQEMNRTKDVGPHLAQMLHSQAYLSAARIPFTLPSMPA